LWGLPRSTLRALFGLNGEEIYLQARGMDARPLAAGGRPRSVSRETTFLEDLWDRRLLLAHLAYLCDRLTLALRRERLHAHIIETRVRYSDFRTEGRRRLLVSPLQDMDGIFRVARELFQELTAGARLSLRLVGVKASDLTRGKPLSLFEPFSERGERLGDALDAVRDRYGFGSLLTARERMLQEVYRFDRDRGFVLKTASLTK